MEEYLEISVGLGERFDIIRMGFTTPPFVDLACPCLIFPFRAKLTKRPLHQNCRHVFDLENLIYNSFWKLLGLHKCEQTTSMNKCMNSRDLEGSGNFKDRYEAEDSGGKYRKN